MQKDLWQGLTRHLGLIPRAYDENSQEQWVSASNLTLCLFFHTYDLGSPVLLESLLRCRLFVFSLLLLLLPPILFLLRPTISSYTPPLPIQGYQSKCNPGPNNIRMYDEVVTAEATWAELPSSVYLSHTFRRILRAIRMASPLLNWLSKQIW